MSFIILILIGLLILYFSEVNYRKIYLSFKIPGPFPLPFIGNGLLFINKSGAEKWKTCEQLVKDYGDYVSIWIGSEFGVLLNNPRDLEVVLTSPKFNVKSESYRYLTPWLHEGLLLSSGSKWLQRRKLLTPAFHFKALDDYIKIFNRQSSVFVDILSRFKTTDKVELFPLAGLCTLDVICEAAMGVEMNAQRNADSEYVTAVKTMNHVINSRMTSSFYRSDIIFRLSTLYKQQSSALKILHEFTDAVIRERREKILAQRNDTANGEDENESSKTTTFLDILLQGNIDGKPLSDSDIREEVDTFMFEGHDTTKSAMSFCFYSVARYPEIQQKCYEEIRNVIGDDRSKAVSFNELNNLPYLDLVIKETLRLFPSVPLMGRLSSEELTLGNYTIPKGTSLGFSPVMLSRLSTLFENPLEFRPERFLEDTVTEKFTFSFLPFSAGARNCIGQKFAMLELKAVVSKVLRHFELSLAEDSMSDPVLIGEVITTSQDAINYHLKPRYH